MDSRGSYVLEILYLKMKESGPLGGGVRRVSANVDPPMHCYEINNQVLLKKLFFFKSKII